MRSESTWNQATLVAFEETFEASWVFVGFAPEAARTESWFVYEAGPRSLLICRDATGKLGAFINACTHRGTRLCSKDGSGRIQCPYHGWVFDTAGRLLGATRRAGLPDFDDLDYGLVRQAVSQIGDLVFVHGDVAPRVDARTQLGESCEAALRLGTQLSVTTPAIALDPRPWQEVLTNVRLDATSSGGSIHPLPPNALLVEHEDQVTLVEVRPEAPHTSRCRRWSARL